MLIIYPFKFNTANMLDVDFNKKVMRRVRLVYLIRKITNPLVVEGLILSTFVIISTNYVSFKNVIANSLSVGNFGAIQTFWLNAFQKTDLPIAITIGTAVFSGLFIYQFVIIQSSFFFPRIGNIYRRVFRRERTSSLA